MQTITIEAPEDKFCVCNWSILKQIPFKLLKFSSMNYETSVKAYLYNSPFLSLVSISQQYLVNRNKSRKFVKTKTTNSNWKLFLINLIVIIIPTTVYSDFI